MHLLDQDNDRIHLKCLELVLTAGGAVNCVAQPRRDSSPKMGSYQLVSGDQTIFANLEVTSILSGPVARNWLLQIVPRENTDPPEPILRLWQRGFDEGLWDYLQRWLAPSQLKECNNRFGDLAHIESVFSPGSVLLAPPGSNTAGRLRLVDVLCFENGASFAGFFQLPSGAWTAYADCPYSNDPNRLAILSPLQWKICEALDNTSPSYQSITRWLKRSFFLNPDSQVDWLRSQIGEAVFQFDDQPNDQIPFRPMTIRWNQEGPYRFCHTLRFQFEFNDAKQDANDKNPECNTFVTLGLSPRRAKDGKGTLISPPVLLAGKFGGWEDNNPYLLKLLPPDPGKVPLVKAFLAWQLAKGSKPQHLLGALVVPGFVRDSHSAFWSQLEAGRDHVVFFLRAGGLPLVLGSIQQMRKGLSELSLAASQLGLSGITDDGKVESKVVINHDGTIAVTASASLKALDNVEITADSMTISSKTVIKNKLEVGQS